jgi:hypothetical protein
MSIMKQLILTLCLFYGINTLTHAERAPSETRGELLYTTHCNGCHSSVIHWREKKLVVDWKSLKDQVNRWQSFIKLGWSEDDINDVAHYLNKQYYNFFNTASKALSEGEESKQTLSEYE